MLLSLDLHKVNRFPPFDWSFHAKQLQSSYRLSPSPLSKRLHSLIPSLNFQTRELEELNGSAQLRLLPISLSVVQAVNGSATLLGIPLPGSVSQGIS